MCNTGAILPGPGYLEGVREACTKTGTVLIFDEVITGFRVSTGGTQQRLGITPDLTIFGKAVANGFPVAGLAGKAALMDEFASGRKVMCRRTATAIRSCRSGACRRRAMSIRTCVACPISTA